MPAQQTDGPPAAFLPPQGNTVESEHLSELTEEEYEAHYIRRQDLKGFLWLDAKYLNPFFTRRLTQEVGHRPMLPSLRACAGPEQGGAGKVVHVLRSAGRPGRRLPLALSAPGPQAGICWFSSAARFSAGLRIDLLTQFAFPE